MDIVLIAGLWLPASVWSDVADELEQAGHRPLPVALPGVDNTSAATLDDQIAAAISVVDSAARPLVVGHSAACTLAWIVADQRPQTTGGIALIGGFPNTHGTAYADFFDITDGLMPFPGWAPFDGPDSADLDTDQRHFIESIVVPVPERVAKGTVQLTDDRRFDIPVTVVCPEFNPEQARQWIADGDAPELASVSNVVFENIDSGHWPMLTKPNELAKILGRCVATGRR